MKKFLDGGECFALSVFKLTRVPICRETEQEETFGAAIARTICEDACYLSADGRGQTAVESQRIAGSRLGDEIVHLISVRTHDHSEKACVIRQEALTRGLCSSLHQSGYVYEEFTYEQYRSCVNAAGADVVWLLKKQELQECGIRGSYTSVPIVDSVDWKQIYSALSGTGCSFCIQVIPSLLTEEEQKTVHQNSAACFQAVDGAVANMGDRLAQASAERWKYYAERTQRPAAEVNILVCGDAANAALLTARLRQSVSGAVFTLHAVKDYREMAVYHQPWRIAARAKECRLSGFTKWSLEEAAQIFRLPEKKDFFIGVRENPYSFLPENDLLPESMTACGREQLLLGNAIFSQKKIFLPLGQFLLHTAVFGKSGARKTTFLKFLLGQFQRAGIPTLVLEPVKREYRDTAVDYPGGKIFTVESPVFPLLMNPFLVPEGVMLSEYRSSLVSAFKAAISMPDPLPALFEKAISEAYLRYGWTDSSSVSTPGVRVFDIADFIRVFKRVIARSAYSRDVKGNMMSGGAFRLQSFLERCPHTFDTLHSTDIKELLSGCSVLEMGSLEPEQKSLVSALTLIRILAFLKATRKSENILRNIILIDEAHALLDQGEGATVEEKSLNSTMTQLMINIITEMRAYGVGVIFSDQSPTRIGGRMIDNVDNVFSFRLSGEEAAFLARHMGVSEDAEKCLPLMPSGELIVKNQYLRQPLAVRMQYDKAVYKALHITDEQIADSQREYLDRHAKDYFPYRQCSAAGCSFCSAKIREEARKYAAQIFYERQSQLKKADETAQHLISVPQILAKHLTGSLPERKKKICLCTAVHLLRICAAEHGLVFGEETTARLLEALKAKIDGGIRDEGI